MPENENPGTTILGENLETEEQTATQQTDNTTQVSDQTETVDYLSTLVGEGKKFSTAEEAVAALAKKAVHADQFIETLKAEKTDLETQMGSAKKVEDILDILNKESDTGFNTQTFETTLSNDRSGEDSEEDVGTAVARILKEREEASATATKLKTIKENQDKSWEMLTESLGDLDTAKLAVKNYIEGDIVKAEIINQLGSHKPSELVKFIKSQMNTKDPSTTTTTRRTVSEFDTNSSLTWSKAREVKKDNPKLYKSHKFQSLLHSAAGKDENFFNK
jgi:hypothetical protein